MSVGNTVMTTTTEVGLSRAHEEAMGSFLEALARATVTGTREKDETGKADVIRAVFGLLLENVQLEDFPEAINYSLDGDSPKRTIRVCGDSNAAMMIVQQALEGVRTPEAVTLLTADADGSDVSTESAEAEEVVDFVQPAALIAAYEHAARTERPLPEEFAD